MSDQTEKQQREIQGQEPEKEKEPVADPREEPTPVVDEEADPDGASRTRSPTAPASAGKPVADHRGEVDPEHSPDLRPKDTEGAQAGKPEGETVVPDPTVSDASRTGSAGAASAMAGSGGPERDPEPNPNRGETDELEEEKPEDWGE